MPNSLFNGTGGNPMPSGLNGFNPQQMVMNMMMQRNPQMAALWQQFQQNPQAGRQQAQQMLQQNQGQFNRQQFVAMAKQMGAADADIDAFLNNLNIK